MRCPTRPRTTPGYSLIELLVVFTVMATLALLGYPALQKMIHRNRVDSFHTEVSTMMQLSRYEAIKRRVPTVVRFNFNTNQIESFADVDDDGKFQPDPNVDPRETDYVIGAPAALPVNLFIWAPQDATPKGNNAIDGLSPPPSPGDIANMRNQAVFTPRGSIRAIGAFRFGDEIGNFLEVRISPRASGRIQIRKWDADEGEWFARGEDGQPWKWY